MSLKPAPKFDFFFMYRKGYEFYTCLERRMSLDEMKYKVNGMLKTIYDDELI